MILAALLSIVLPESLARMPVRLPNYDLECRAGAMTSPRIMKMNVHVRSDQGLRAGFVRTDNGSGKAIVTSRTILLVDSIGGEGFSDQIQYEMGGKRAAVRISVRGGIENDIIDFRIERNDAEPGSTRYVGVCRLAEKKSAEGVAQ